MRKSIIRMIATFISGCIVTGLVPVTAWAASSSAVFYEDFSEYESGSSDFAFGQFIGDAMALDEYRNFDRIYNIGTALSINSGKMITYNEKMYYDQTGSDYSLTEFDLYLDKRSGAKSAFNISPSTTYGDYESFATLRIEKNKLLIRSNEAEYNELYTLEENRWHHFCIRMTDAYKESDLYYYTVSLEVDGVEVYLGTETRDERKMKQLPYYDMLKIGNRSNLPVAYIDNITLICNETSNYDGLEKLFYSVRKTEEMLYEYSFMENTPSYEALKNKHDEGIKLLQYGGVNAGEDILEQEESSGKVCNVKMVEYWDALTADTEGTVPYKNDDALVAAIRNLEVQADICADELAILQDELTQGKQAVLELKDIGFSDGKDNIDVRPENGKISSITIKNTTEEEITGMVITAFYQEDDLVGCGLTQNCVFQPGVNTIDIEDVTYENNATDAFLYIWKDWETLSPVIERVNIKDGTVSDDIDIYVDNQWYFTDLQACKMMDGRIYVPAENVLNLIGASVRENGKGYHAERIDGTYMDFNAAFYAEDIVPMVEIKEICNAFGCTYSYSVEENKLWINSNYTESLNTRVPLANEIEYSNIGKASFLFKINCDSNATVEAYTRVTDVPKYRITDETGLSTYQKWSVPLESVLVWKKAYDLNYEDGGYVGSFAGLQTRGEAYDIIFKITKNGSTEMLQDKVQLKSATPTIDDVRYEADSLVLKSTFENISYYLAADEVAGVAVYYKKNTDEVWSKGYAPVYNTKLGQYTGSVTGMNPNTDYEIKLVLDDIEHIATIKTWDENPQYTEVNAADFMTESGTVVLQGIKGTEDNWIKIISDSVINGGESNVETVYISDCEYLILDGLEIDGARRHAVSVSGGSENIRIQNCNIYGWGRCGVWSDIRHRYMRDLDAVNYDAAIRLNDADKVVIERCYIHDSNARCNTWYRIDYDSNHPTGPSAIYSNMNSGLVVRYNDFIGNSINRWNDAIEGDKNGELLGGVGFDADIYGNMFFGGNDDAMELDGGSMNVRVYKNRIEQTYCGISYAPILLGPTYTFGNLIYNLGDREEYSSTSLKQKTLDATETAGDRGEQFLFNNTMITRDYARVMNTKAINNLLCSDYSVPAISSKHTGDYNFLYGHTSNISFKENEIYGKFPRFTDATTGNYTLSQESEAKDNGTLIDNFMSIENPDMGAFVYGDKFLPARPLDMSADKYSITLKNGETETITFSAGNVDGGLSYSIEKSDKEAWLEVEGDLSGRVGNGGRYTIAVTADMSLMNKEVKVQNDTLCAAVLFRLSNGYSIPITVKTER